MPRRIYILDTTLRDGEQTPKVNLNTREKLAIAGQLEELGVDIIEAGFAAASKGDFLAVKSVAETVKGCAVASLARAVNADIQRAWEALRQAVSPRLNIVLATSEIHMKYKLRMTEEDVLEAAERSVRLAKSLCAEVEFSAEDASRSDRAFLCRVLNTVIRAGATTVNITDTVGYAQPVEFAELIRFVKENVSNIDRALIAVHCHNDLGLAVANSLAGIEAGAGQVECTINGLGERAGNAALEEIVMNISARGDRLNALHGVDTTKLLYSSRMVRHYTGIDVQPNKAIVGENAFLHQSGIHQHGILAERSTYEIITPQSVGYYEEDELVLGKLSGSHAFERRLQKLGYHLSEEDLKEAFSRFKALCDRKKEVEHNDLIAVVEGTLEGIRTNIPPMVELDEYSIRAGNRVESAADVSILRNGARETASASGDGPVDAAYHAIDSILRMDISLQSYSIKAVTGGKDALGEVMVRIKYKDEIYLGKGVSTDIIESSILAYLSAVNRALADI